MIRRSLKKSRAISISTTLLTGSSLKIKLVQIKIFLKEQFYKNTEAQILTKTRTT